jgi:CDP-diacylglycerol---glycerol-3-phosphate 3-phosphatidyltransferase
MNLPNRLTVLRMVLVPVFLVFELLPITRYHLLFALVVFAAASITDLIDGKIARRNNQATDFGKLMDPLADKLLVSAALLGFVKLGYADVWIAIIIIGRELLVTSLRSVASNKGTVIAANIWGKAKTVSQMIAIIAVLFIGGLQLPGFWGQLGFWVGYGLLWVAAAFTVASGAQYVWVNRKYISTKDQH